MPPPSVVARASEKVRDDGGETRARLAGDVFRFLIR